MRPVLLELARRSQHLLALLVLLKVVQFCTQPSIRPASMEEPASAAADLWYSQGRKRKERTGDHLLDMFMASAYAIKHNKTYAGVCAKWYKRQDVMGMLSVLGIPWKYKCPTSSGHILHRSSYKDIPPPELYTAEWRASLPLRKFEKTADVVVHIRRGDVNPCIYPNRYLTNTYYKQVIQQFASGRPVTIYSESKTFEDFAEFRQLGYKVVLDSSLPEIWTHMLSSELLIISKSYFSYAPGLLHDNVVYTPFWRLPLADWHVVSNETLHAETAATIQRLHDSPKCKRARLVNKSLKPVDLVKRKVFRIAA